MELPIGLKLGYGHETKKSRKVIRIEADKFKVCEPKVERKQKLIGEDIWVIHRTEDDKWDIKKLK